MFTSNRGSKFEPVVFKNRASIEAGHSKADFDLSGVVRNNIKELREEFLHAL